MTAARTEASGPPPPVSRQGGRRRWGWLILGPLVVVVGVGWLWVNGGRFVVTDDAVVGADKVTIRTDIPGFITVVAVHDNETVQEGQLLFRIDNEPYALALAGAEARLGMVANQLAALRASYRQVVEQMKAADDDLRFSERAFRRQGDLAARKVISESQRDAAAHTLDAARQRLTALQAQVAGMRAQLSGDPDLPDERQPSYRAAQAECAKARRDLAHTDVRAPTRGIVTRVTSLQPGQYLAAAAPAFSLVSTEAVWIEANPKETDLTWVVPGQAARVTIDTYPGVRLAAVVESLSPATGSEFSLLPAQNVSGNWIKVVQRIPVRLRLLDGASAPPLRVGMSAAVAIDTGRERSFAALLRDMAAAAAGTLP